MQRFDESRSVSIQILDAGLTEPQRQELNTLVDGVVAPSWPEGISEERTKGLGFLKACVCRPFLPNIFPGFENYVWMDADTWVQDWNATALFLDGTARYPDRFIGTCSADRCYPRQLRVKWLWRMPFKVRNFYYSNARKPFGFEAARELLPRYTISAGCFALGAVAPHWERWQELALIAMQKGDLFTAEQVALGVLLHLEGFRYEMLPAYAHWVCGLSSLLWDEEQSLFVEPFLPHVPVGILHLSGVDDMRGSRTAKRELKTIKGEKIWKNIRYPYFDGGPLGTGKPERK